MAFVLYARRGVCLQVSEESVEDADYEGDSLAMLYRIGAALECSVPCDPPPPRGAQSGCGVRPSDHRLLEDGGRQGAGLRVQPGQNVRLAGTP